MPSFNFTLGRREFMQTSALALAATMLRDLALPSEIFAQATVPTIPTSPAIPAVYQAHPGLLALRADALLQQLNNGFGYYGQPRNWVTLYSLPAMQGSIQTTLQNEVQLAQRLDQLGSILAADLQTSATYDDAVSAAQALQVRINQNIDDDNDKVKILRQAIDDLLTDINAQLRVVHDTQDQFSAAVQNAASGGCGFATIFAVVIAVVAVVAAVVTAGTSLVAAYAAIGDLAATGLTAATAGATAFAAIEKAYDEVKPIVTKVETAIDDVNKVKAQYDKLQTELSVAEAAANSGRVLVEQTSFDSLAADKLKTFDQNVDGAAGVPQAIKDQFKAAVHKYFDLAQLRNKKIMEHDGTIIDIQNSARQYFEQELQIAVIKGMKSRWFQTAQIADKSAYVSSISNIQDAQLDVMRRVVWNEMRAQAFQQLNPDLLAATALVQIHSKLAPDLLLAHTGIVVQQLDFNTNRAQVLTDFSTDDLPLQLKLSSDDIKSILTSYRYRFTIRPGDPPYTPHMKEIFVTGFKITFDPPASTFSGELVHMGRHLFQTTDGTVVEFSSEPKPIGFNASTHPKLIRFAESSDHPGLHGFSALGDWTISIDPGTSKDLIKNLQAITISFSGYSQAG